MRLFDMGLFKDWKVTGITDKVSKDISSRNVFELGQCIKDGGACAQLRKLKPDPSIDMTVEELLLFSIETIDLYTNSPIDRLHDPVIKALVYVSAAMFGYDSKAFNYREVRNLAQGLYGSIIETPETFRFKNMPIILELKKNLES